MLECHFEDMFFPRVVQDYNPGPWTGSQLVSPASGHEKKVDLLSYDPWTVGFDANAPKTT